MIGRTISHYQIIEKLGEGGMGVVYKALDTRLGRSVAIKVVNTEFTQRFEREAKAISALNHPHICTLYDVGEHEGAPYLVMEYVEGKPLKGPLPLGEALRYSIQTAQALAAAHKAGIVHRDLKPDNILLTSQGSVKVLDFGLAKLQPTITTDVPKLTTMTKQGGIVGTGPYMSPEQAQGEPVDARSDIFSFGAVLYELLSGRRAFRGETLGATLAAVIVFEPPPLREAPPEVARIVGKMLAKKREARYPSGEELHRDLLACQARLTRAPSRLWTSLRRPRYAAALALLVAALTVGTGWLWVRGSRSRWARDQALPEITRLIEKGDFYSAFRVAREAERYIPGNVALQRLWRTFTIPVSLRSTPPGAEVYLKPYLPADAPWDFLGRTPIENVLFPTANIRWKFTRPGFETRETAFGGSLAGLLFGNAEFRLEPVGTRPPGMVSVPGGSYQLGSLPATQLQDYWIDKYEVTNRQFKEFVDKGGYQNRAYWKQPFVKDGRTLTWEQTIGEFSDTTGRPGPSTWQLGTYPEGQDDFPVGGVNWYEAAAYAEFAGKSLPTVYHWYNAAAGVGLFSDILEVSNFGGRGPARVGSHQGLSPSGAYDMAGNVKEWCWNRSGERRYILGGAWNEPVYMFIQDNLHAQLPFDRSPTYGFRCVKYSSPPPDTLTGPIERVFRDFGKEKPVGDETFHVFKSFYSYDRTDLKPRVESVDESPRHWRRERISFDAAYGNARVLANLFLPRNAVPPYQTLIYFPGLQSMYLNSSEHETWANFVVQSGRALLWPIYCGMYERRGELSASGPGALRDRTICWSKDLGRSIDYLETRQDIDRQKLAYYGVSMGAHWAPLLIAIEERLKVGVLELGGFYQTKYPPEVDPFNFAPRVRIPVLMINGRYDFRFPLETAQLPLVRTLGTPYKDKRHVLFESGHVPVDRAPVMKEVLSWLDRYLGPVKTTP
jgi:predicted Ser/Thr protein kinase